MLALLFANALGSSIDTVSVIPRPSQIQVLAGPAFLFRGQVHVVTNESSSALTFLADTISDCTGLAPRVSTTAPQNAEGPVVTLQRANDLPTEGYRLFAQGKEIVINYGGWPGLFYAVQTIRQLLPPEIESINPKSDDWSIPAVRIADSPRFSWRGMHLDVSRHFFPTSFIKRYIDFLAMNKMNVFHWHLVDDGGWRMQVDKYPRLTEIGAWRVDTGGKWPGGDWNYGSLRFIVQRGQGKKYGGFYTKSEIRDIVAYAKERNVTVVPEIEMPGHSMPAVIAYQHLACEGVDRHPEAGGSVTNVFCAGKESTFEFLEDVLKETMDLFPSKYIHIGADEVSKVHWQKCPMCQKRIKDEGLKDENELQSYFVKRIERFLVANKRSLVGWDEILEGGLAPEATVMSWRGTQGGIDAARAGHDVVMSPTSHCYFDYPYESISTKSVYGWEPVPDILTQSEANRVLGGQANLWTEGIPTTQRAEYMVFPRMLAMAEVLWSPKEHRDWDDFSSRLMRQYARLGVLGVNYHILPPTVDFTAAVFQERAIVSARTEDGEPFTLRYSMGDTDPTKDSPSYEGPISVEKSTTISFALVSQSGNVGEVTRVYCVKTNPHPEAGLVNGLEYAEFGGEWARVPDFSKLTPRKSGTTDEVGLFGNDGESFALKFTGFIKIEKEGVYRFRLGSDDGSYLAISGAKVVDHDGLHGYNEKEGAVRLSPGVYPLEIGFFEAGGSQELTVKVQVPGGLFGPVPQGMFLRKAS